MSFLKIIGNIVLILLVVFIILFFLLVRACKNGDLYQAGSGLGSVASVEDYKYQDHYYKKYADSFFKVYPQYKVPKGTLRDNRTSGYEFLDMTKFYFDKEPREVYCVQWQGIDVRIAYDVDNDVQIIETPRNNHYIDSIQRKRMSNRLRTEVIEKIDSIIAASPDKDSALLKRF